MSDIGDRYNLLERIGEGGMGEVWRAEQKSVRRTVAVKLLHGDLMRHSTARQRVLQEAIALGRVDHRNVVRVIECFETRSTVVLVLEYVADGSLADRIQSDGAIPWPKTVEQLRGILKGLSAIHNVGLVHRDMKPDNILISVDADGEVVPKIADLGIAHDSDATRLTRDGSRLGTPEYMAPEQIRGYAVDARSDIYAVGIVLYEMLTGDVPFSGTDYDIQHAHVSVTPDLQRLPQDTPEWLKNALLKALAKDPEHRFASASEFMAALNENANISVVTPATPIASASSAAPAPRASQPSSAIVDPKLKEVRDLHDLLQQGVLTQAEFDKAKKALLRKGAPQRARSSAPVDDEFMLPCPPTHLGTAIMVTLFCCLPLGIVSIFKANNVDTVYARSGHTAALQASEEARQWVNYSAVGGIVFIFLWILGNM